MPAPLRAPRAVVRSPLPAAFDAGSRVLLLGSLPSPASRELGYHYANPHNRFWRVLAALWDEPVPRGGDACRLFLTCHHLALHDVLQSARIRGAADASIEDPVPNDLAPLLAASQITHVFCTGSVAARLYARHIEPTIGIACTRLPSTSPANASWSLERLVAAYEPVRQAVEEGGRSRA